MRWSSTAARSRRSSIARSDRAAGEEIDLGGGVLSPGFVDWQINGGGGVLFNAEPTVEGIAKIAAAHRREGVTGFLPTVVTDAPEVLAAALDGARARRLGACPARSGFMSRDRSSIRAARASIRRNGSGRCARSRRRGADRGARRRHGRDAGAGLGPARAVARLAAVRHYRQPRALRRHRRGGGRRFRRRRARGDPSLQRDEPAPARAPGVVGGGARRPARRSAGSSPTASTSIRRLTAPRSPPRARAGSR